MSAPVRPRRIRSRPSRSSVPGATAARVARSESSSRSSTAQSPWYAVGPVARSLTATAGQRGEDRAADIRALMDVHALRGGATAQDPCGDVCRAEAEPCGLGQATRDPDDRSELTCQAQLAERD